MPPENRYTYEKAGFNGFMIRSRKSNPVAQTLAGQISNGTKSVDFDRQQVGGPMGDKLKIGRLIHDGRKGRVVVLDKAEINEVGWVGDLTD